jgi:hypothetical protein
LKDEAFYRTGSGQQAVIKTVRFAVPKLAVRNRQAELQAAGVGAACIFIEYFLH